MTNNFTNKQDQRQAFLNMFKGSNEDTNPLHLEATSIDALAEYFKPIKEYKGLELIEVAPVNAYRAADGTLLKEEEYLNNHMVILKFKDTKRNVEITTGRIGVHSRVMQTWSGWAYHRVWDGFFKQFGTLPKKPEFNSTRPQDMVKELVVEVWMQMFACIGSKFNVLCYINEDGYTAYSFDTAEFADLKAKSIENEAKMQKRLEERQAERKANSDALRNAIKGAVSTSVPAFAKKNPDVIALPGRKFKK